MSGGPILLLDKCALQGLSAAEVAALPRCFTNGSIFVVAPTWASPGTGLLGWSAKLHSAGNTSGAGNILLGDGSCQQVTSANFRLNWLKNAEDAGNFDTAPFFTALGDVAMCFP
jgi:hypothetical protein